MNELDCLLVVLAGLDDHDVQQRLVDQIEETVVTNRLSMHTELSVSTDALRASLPDGPLDVRATAFDSNGVPTGFVSVWLSGGLLSSTSFGWVTEEMPDDFPPADTLRMDG